MLFIYKKKMLYRNYKRLCFHLWKYDSLTTNGTKSKEKHLHLVNGSRLTYLISNFSHFLSLPPWYRRKKTIAHHKLLKTQISYTYQESLHSTICNDTYTTGSQSHIIQCIALLINNDLKTYKGKICARNIIQRQIKNKERFG